MLMKKWIAGLMLIGLSIYTSGASAVTLLLTSYHQLVKALEQAEDVKAIIHLDLCDITDDALQEQLAQNLDAATTRFNFTHYLHYKSRTGDQLKDVVTTNAEYLVERSPGVFVKVLGNLTVLDDNTATLRVGFYSPNLQTKYLVVDFLCDISNGRDDNGLYLYDFP